MEKKQWENEIQKAHPIITYYPKDKWPLIVRLNGWLPLPPENKHLDTFKKALLLERIGDPEETSEYDDYHSTS